MYDRLIACGYTDKMATDICELYSDDPNGLKAYVEIAEILYKFYRHV